MGSTEPVPVKVFLETIPPDTTVVCDQPRVLSVQMIVNIPTIEMHCYGECTGVRQFTCINKSTIAFDREEDLPQNIILRYKCRNCGETIHDFSIAGIVRGEDLYVFKLGQFPVFGPPTPTAVLELVGKEREHYLSGRRCLNQGLGMGAFVYFRRIVENQWSHILSNAVEAMEKSSVPEERLAKFRDAQKEVQFKKSLKLAKEAVPSELMIDTHNPFAMLHAILSVGVHELSDDECLDYAEAVRILLVDLANRIEMLRSTHGDLRQAFTKISKRLSGQ